MENCGAYLFEWRPIDCGNGNYFAILVGGNTITESNVILNRGYDYAYTFDPMTYARPWGTVPDLVNTDGVWAIPENWGSLPEGTQPVLQIILKTNNKNLDTDKRYINVVHLPNGTDTSSLPPEVRKYLINVDGSDAGAYNGTVTPGWQTEADGSKKYLKPDGTYITNGWLTLEDEQYYMDERGVMLKDTVTPDGHYVTPEGKRVSYMPGWFQDTDGWRYIQKNGYYLANSWFQDTDGKYYYFNMAALMAGELLEDILGHLGVEKTYTANADVLVPNLSGLNLADATSALQKNSLTLRTVGDGGTVTGQIPAAGASIPGGSQVVLYMGEAVPTDQVQVPSVIGLTAEQARQKLADAGLYMRATGATEYGSHVVAYEQSTAAGASVNRGTTIEVRFTDSTASGAGL